MHWRTKLDTHPPTTNSKQCRSWECLPTEHCVRKKRNNYEPCLLSATLNQKTCKPRSKGRARGMCIAS